MTSGSFSSCPVKFSEAEIIALNQQHRDEVARLDLKVHDLREWMVINVRGDNRCQTWALIASGLDLLPLKNGISQSQTFTLNYPGGYDKPEIKPDWRLVERKDQLDRLVRDAFEQSFKTNKPFVPLLKELEEIGPQNTDLNLATILYENLEDEPNMRNPERLMGRPEDWPEVIQKLELKSNDATGNRTKLLRYVIQLYSQKKEYLQRFLEEVLNNQPGNLIFKFAQSYLPDTSYEPTFLSMKHKNGKATLTLKNIFSTDEVSSPSSEVGKMRKVVKSFFAHAQNTSGNSGHFQLAIPVTNALRTALSRGYPFPEAEIFTKNPGEPFWIGQTTAPTFGGGSAAPASCLAVPKPDAKVIVTQALLEAGIKGDVSALDVIRTAAIQTQEMRKEFQQVILFEKNENVFVVTLYDLDSRETYVRLQPEPLIQQPPKSQPKPTIVSSSHLSEKTFQDGLRGDLACRNNIRSSAISALKGTPSLYESEIIFEKNPTGYAVTLWTTNGEDHKVCLTPSVEHSPKGGSCSVM